MFSPSDDSWMKITIFIDIRVKLIIGIEDRVSLGLNLDISCLNYTLSLISLKFV